MADLIWYLFIPPIEALAVVEGLDFFYSGLINQQTGVPTLQGVILGVILLLLFVPFNYFGVKVFGRSTLAFGITAVIRFCLEFKATLDEKSHNCWVLLNLSCTLL